VALFFADYLVRRKTNYTWNDISSPSFEVNVGVGQESALSPILSALYLSSFLYILEKHQKNLNIPVSLISFMDDGLIISQNNSIDILNSYLFYSYNVLTKLLDKFVLWDAWDMNNFYFLFLLFSDFIGILFSFSFYFGR